MVNTLVTHKNFNLGIGFIVKIVKKDLVLKFVKFETIIIFKRIIKYNN